MVPPSHFKIKNNGGRDLRKITDSRLQEIAAAFHAITIHSADDDRKLCDKTNCRHAGMKSTCESGLTFDLKSQFKEELGLRIIQNVCVAYMERRRSEAAGGA